MRTDTQVTLVSVNSYTLDGNGNQVPNETSKIVMAKKLSVRQSEFYQASVSGIKPVLMFEVRTVSYNSEKVLIYKNERYSISRTFDKPDEFTEIICGEVLANGY